MAGSPSPMLVILILAFVILFYILKFVQESKYFRKLLNKTSNENNVLKDRSDFNIPQIVISCGNLPPSKYFEAEFQKTAPPAGLLNNVVFCEKSNQFLAPPKFF
ncbi:hypothetical protein CRE_09037 [Caenorhabditis remanei]|uniref:Uncharacterized protein n=1 Tax=Caenorhabditis remanei TaxID=31234 RepID=E3LIX5_CAERE|nr:hypothetical protein CRE_09037 [Caenorhabditis remanei]